MFEIKILYWVTFGMTQHGSFFVLFPETMYRIIFRCELCFGHLVPLWISGTLDKGD